MKKSFLFPYWVQKTGWFLILGWFVWIAYGVSMRLFNISGHDLPLWLGKVEIILFSFLPTVATLMICLSKEKKEDEYIEYIRGRVVFFMVLAFFVTLLLNVSLTNIGTRLWAWSPSNGYMMFSWLYTNPFIITMLYIVFFKGSLFVNWLNTRDNDGQ